MFKPLLCIHCGKYFPREMSRCPHCSRDSLDSVLSELMIEQFREKIYEEVMKVNKYLEERRVPMPCKKGRKKRGSKKKKNK